MISWKDVQVFEVFHNAVREVEGGERHALLAEYRDTCAMPAWPVGPDERDLAEETEGGIEALLVDACTRETDFGPWASEIDWTGFPASRGEA